MESVQSIGEIAIFSTGEGEVNVQVDAVNETVWINQKGMAELFGVTVFNISYHLKKIFDDAELDASAVIKEILITAQSGARGVGKYIAERFLLSAFWGHNRDKNGEK